MKTILKKSLKLFCVCLFICSMIFTTVSAAESNEPDSVLVSYSNEGNYCKSVFMNDGFLFDRCDIGTLNAGTF